MSRERLFELFLFPTERRRELFTAGGKLTRKMFRARAGAYRDLPNDREGDRYVLFAGEYNGLQAAAFSGYYGQGFAHSTRRSC